MDSHRPASVEPIEIRTPTHVATGLLRRARGPSRRLLVALPGGGCAAGSFDTTPEHGNSLLCTAADAGWHAVALNRPGYDGSTGVPDADFGLQASAVAESIAAFAAELTGDVDQVFLVGHSIGGMIALRVAAAHADGLRLRAVACTGIGTQFHPGVVDRLLSRPADLDAAQIVEMKRGIMFGPATGYEHATAQAAQVDYRVTPFAELEQATRFPLDLGELGGAIRVPVHYRLGQFDALWIADGPHVDAFRAAFTHAIVDAAIEAGAGHSVDHHRSARALHRGQLRFAEAHAG